MVGSAAPRQLTRGGKQHRTACVTHSACITYPTAVTLQLLSIPDTESSQYVSSPHVNPMQGGIFLENAYEMVNLGLKHPFKMVFFLIFLCESNRYFGKAPMK